MKRQRRIGVEARALEPGLPLVAVFEPVAATQTTRRLLGQERGELALVVVERDEAQVKARRRLAELLLETHQPRDLFFARLAPSRPKVHPGIATAQRERLGQRRLAA